MERSKKKVERGDAHSEGGIDRDYKELSAFVLVIVTASVFRLASARMRAFLS